MQFKETQKSVVSNEIKQIKLVLAYEMPILLLINRSAICRGILSDHFVVEYLSSRKE